MMFFNNIVNNNNHVNVYEGDVESVYNVNPINKEEAKEEEEASGEDGGGSDDTYSSGAKSDDDDLSDFDDDDEAGQNDKAAVPSQKNKRTRKPARNADKPKKARVS
jgi:hypothetical protein